MKMKIEGSVPLTYTLHSSLSKSNVCTCAFGMQQSDDAHMHLLNGLAHWRRLFAVVRNDSSFSERFVLKVARAMWRMWINSINLWYAVTDFSFTQLISHKSRTTSQHTCIESLFRSFNPMAKLPTIERNRNRKHKRRNRFKRFHRMLRTRKCTNEVTAVIIKCNLQRRQSKKKYRKKKWKEERNGDNNSTKGNEDTR